MNRPTSLAALLRSVALPALLIALPLATLAQDQRTFPTPEAAVDAFVSAMKASDEQALIGLLGSQHKNLVVTGDPANDAAKRAEMAALLTTFRALDERGPDRRVLLIGDQAWPLPIPIIRTGGTWRFATEQGAEEILNRRIGSNERRTITVLQATVYAQRDYASRDRDGDGVLQYAGRIGSSPGKFDGLYWPADESKGEEASPLGPLVAQSAAYPGRKPGDAFHGYYYRILTSQGKNAAGGAYNYMINGRLVAGFGMAAYPAVYGETGVMTFIINHNGKVYEKDLGSNTAAIAVRLSTFDPGAGWKAVEP